MKKPQQLQEAEGSPPGAPSCDAEMLASAAGKGAGLTCCAADVPAGSAGKKDLISCLLLCGRSAGCCCRQKAAHAAI